MPVIGCDNRHDLNVLPIEQLAIVLVNLDRPLAALLRVLLEGLGLSLCRVLGIDIADGHAVRKIHGLRTHRVPAIPRTDAAQKRPVVFALGFGVLGDEWRGPPQKRARWAT